MTIRKRWPTHAEDLRLDCIALTLDIDLWQVRLEEALRRGDAVEVARLNVRINRANRKVRLLLQQAKRL
jgi:hypothetical protein